MSGLSERGQRPRGAKPAAEVRPEFKISAARVAAFEILERVGATSDHSDDLLHGRRLAGMSQADKNLATTLVLGVLRWQIALDAAVRPFLQRPDLALASPVATALRMGAFQLLHLDRIPAHAALSESVELVKAAGHPHAAGMVNAVLRKVAGGTAAKPKLFESTAAFAERLGHPRWLVERWVARYGRAAALAICEYDQTEGGGGDLFAGVGDADDSWGMDEGSRLVAEVAARFGVGAKRVWDACAAPGGKTKVLAERLAGAEVLATDLSARRLEAMAARLKTGGVEVRVLAADAARLPVVEGEFDLILCDVPCSGTGTLARNPEIRHKLEPAELGRQAKRQREILKAAAERLAVGGRLIYSTCSLEAEECEGVVEAVEMPGGVERVSLEGMVAEVLGERGEGLVREGYLRTLPGVGFKGDGF
ncbi:MAG: transcription antitermination factor NusB, partial [Acidobacteriota bacterium]